MWSLRSIQYKVKGNQYSTVWEIADLTAYLLSTKLSRDRMPYKCNQLFQKINALLQIWEAGKPQNRTHMKITHLNFNVCHEFLFPLTFSELVSSVLIRIAFD